MTKVVPLQGKNETTIINFFKNKNTCSVYATKVLVLTKCLYGIYLLYCYVSVSKITLETTVVSFHYHSVKRRNKNVILISSIKLLPSRGDFRISYSKLLVQMYKQTNMYVHTFSHILHFTRNIRFQLFFGAP